MRLLILLAITLSVVMCRAKTQHGLPLAPNAKESQPGSEVSAIASDEIKEVGSFYERVMKIPFETKLSAVAMSADAKFVPYSGYYYYERLNNKGLNGTNGNDTLTRYDSAFGAKAAAWERKNHYTAPNHPDAPWAGHCTGWSAAASRLGEPPTDVTMNGVTFTRQDIKALLAEIYMSGLFISLGGKRCREQTIPRRPFQGENLETLSVCQDVNPGTFLLALANTVGGREHLPLLFDLSADIQVWNFPIYRYECLNCREQTWKSISAKEAKEIIAGSAYGANTIYQFNKKAEKWYDVKLRVTYTEGSASGETLDQPTPKSKDYRFIVETDAKGDILGGEWASEHQADHPDVVRLALDPVRGIDDRRYANPELDPEVVMNLWRASWRAAGKAEPDEGKNLPTWESLWGQQSDYHLSIDGLMSGAAFLGAPNTAEIKLVGKRLEDAKLTAALNGEIVQDMSIGKKISFELTLKSGLNNLTLSWRKTNIDETQDFQIYVIP